MPGVPEAERPEIHLRIGRVLAAGTAPEQLNDTIFEIVSQLDRGAELIVSPAERLELAQLNLIAGKRAKAATAYGAAAQYLSTGRGLLLDDAWEHSYRLIFEIELNLAECEFLIGDLALAQERLALLTNRAVDSIDLAAVTRVLLDLFVKRGDMNRAVEIGTGYLRRSTRDGPPKSAPNPPIGNMNICGSGCAASPSRGWSICPR